MNRLAALCLALAPIVDAGGQKAHTLLIGVLSDSGKANVIDADVVVIEGLNTTLSRVRTDSAGFARLTFKSIGGSVQLSIRKLGFEPVARFLDLANLDTLGLVVNLERRVQQLDTVAVLAAEDPKHKSYYIDADAIVATGRPVYSALDVLTRLRPDMITTRAPEACADSTGPLPGRHTRNPPVGGIANVWVNGVRIRLVETSPWVKVPYMREAFIRREIRDILDEIRPEHIADIQFADCFDNSVPVLGGQSAVFIRLKEGIAYERGRGSYVRPSEVPSLASMHQLMHDSGITLPDVTMRTTLNLDDALLEKASRLTGIDERTALIHEGLRELIARESARRLAKLGGTERQVTAIPRRRVAEP